MLVSADIAQPFREFNVGELTMAEAIAEWVGKLGTMKSAGSFQMCYH
jgi:hypothetical protein